MDLWRDRTRKLRVNQVLENGVKSIFNFSVFFFSAELTEINTFFHFFTFSLLAHCTGSPKGCARSVPYRFVWWVFLECTAFVSWINQEITSLSAEFDSNLLACLLNLSEMYWLLFWTFREAAAILLNFPGSTGFSAEFSRKHRLFCWILQEALVFLLNFSESTGFSAEFSRKHRLFCWIFQKWTCLSAQFVRNIPACLLCLSGMYRLVCYVCFECTGLSAECLLGMYGAYCTGLSATPEMYWLVCWVCLECTSTSAENSTVLYPVWIKFDAAFVEGLVWRNLDVLQGSGNTAILLKCIYLLILIDKILL